MSDFIHRPQIEVLSASDGARRRHWSDEDKVRIVEESFIGHRQASATARRHGICRSLLTTWRRQYRNGELGGSGALSFSPVTVAQGGSGPHATPAPHCSAPRECQIEIALTNGRRLVVPSGVDPEALARLLPVVEGV